MDSESAPLWNNVALCYLGKSKLVASIACLKRALSIAPTEWVYIHTVPDAERNNKPSVHIMIGCALQSGAGALALRIVLVRLPL